MAETWRKDISPKSCIRPIFHEFKLEVMRKGLMKEGNMGSTHYFSGSIALENMNELLFGEFTVRYVGGFYNHSRVIYDNKINRSKG